MPETNQFENILPVAPLKIAALESCREFAEKVDRYLVDFRRTANTQHRDNIYFQDYAQDSYLIECSCPRLVPEKPRVVLASLSVAAISLLW